MVVETCCGDLRSEGDPDWLADGAQIELFGLTSEKALFLNGQTAEVVGFDDQHRRYLVKLHESSAVKVVARKNMRLHVTSECELAGAMDDQQTFSKALVLSPQRFPSNPPWPIDVNSPTARVELVPSKRTVQRAVAKVVHDTSVLQQQCFLRQSGIDGINMSDTFVRLNRAIDTYLEIVQMYQTAYSMDEELRRSGSTAVQNAEDSLEDYQKIRTWAEMGIDEINLTKYSIHKHGLVGILKNELVEVGRGVRSGAAKMPGYIRQATCPVGEVAQQQNTRVVAPVTPNTINHDGNRHTEEAALRNDHFLRSMKRTWHVLVSGVFMCYVLPFFALRAYAPLNGVVAHIGLVYVLLCLCCHPCRASRRRTKAGFIVLWPLLVVVLPLVLDYWLLHPEMFCRKEGSSQLGNQCKQLYDLWSPPTLVDSAAESGGERGSKAVIKDGVPLAWLKPLDLRVHNRQSSGFARGRAASWLQTPAEVALHSRSRMRGARAILRKET